MRFTASKISAAVGWRLHSIKKAIKAYRCGVHLNPQRSNDLRIVSVSMYYFGINLI